MSSLYTDDYLNPNGFQANPFNDPYKFRQNFTAGRYNEVSGPGGNYPWYDYAYGSFTDPTDPTIKVKTADCQREHNKCNSMKNTRDRVYCHQQNRGRGCFRGYVPEIDGNPNVQPGVMNPAGTLQADYYGVANYWNSPGYMGSAGKGTNLGPGGIYRGNGRVIYQPNPVPMAAPVAGPIVQTQQQTSDNSVLTDQFNNGNMSHFSSRSGHRMYNQNTNYSGSQHKRLADGERFGSNSIDPALYYINSSAIGQKTSGSNQRMSARRLKMTRGGDDDDFSQYL